MQEPSPSPLSAYGPVEPRTVIAIELDAREAEALGQLADDVPLSVAARWLVTESLRRIGFLVGGR